MRSEDTENFCEFAVGLERLKAIAFRDIVVNGWCFRVLGAHFMDYGPEWNVKKHKHSFYELHYVLQGSVITNLNGKDHDVKAGQFYLMPPGTSHAHHQCAGTSHIGFALRWEFSRVESRQSDLSNTFSDLERIDPLLRSVPMQPVYDNHSVIYEGVANMIRKASENRFMVDLQFAFLEIITHLAGSYSLEVSQVPNQQRNDSFLENHIVENAIDFIEENYMQDIGVNDVSNSAHLSYSHLSRLFRKYSDETIIHHLNKTRLKKAQQLLLCTDRPIGQIAEEVGFSSKNYFCTIFRKFFSLSPGDYRKKMSKLSE